MLAIFILCAMLAGDLLFWALMIALVVAFRG